MKRACVVAAMVALVSATLAALPGLLDTTFNSSGLLAVDLTNGTVHEAKAVAVDSAGRSVAAGDVRDGNSAAYDTGVVRRNADGTPDTSFNGTGKVVHNFGGIEHIVGVAVDALDRVIVAGYSDWNPGCAQATCDGNYNFFVGRFNADGTLDTTFGESGRRIIGFGSDEDYASAMTIDAEGRILVVGQAQYDPGIFSSEIAVIAMARLLPDGAFDTTFGGDGKVLSNAARDNYSVADAVAIDRHGRILIGASAYGLSWVFRYSPDGSIEQGSYQAPYIFQVPGENCYTNRLAAVAVDDWDRIVAAGWCGDYDDRNFSRVLLFRALDNGRFDTSFGNSGALVLNFSSGGLQRPTAMNVDGLGRVTIAGFAQGCGRDLLMARFDSTGALDHRFGLNATGWSTIGFQSEPCSDDQANAMAVDQLGHFVLAGSTRDAAGTHFALARVLDEDPSFDFLLPIAPINVAPGESGNRTLTIFSIDGFDEPLKIGPHGPVPDGITWSFDGFGPIWNPTPVPYDSVSALLTVNVSPLVVPGTYVLSLFDDRFPDDKADVTINVTTTPMAMANLVGQFETAGYIDNAGIAQGLQAMLEASRFESMRHLIVAQAGRHIATTATENGMTFNPAAILISNVDNLIGQQ